MRGSRLRSGMLLLLIKFPATIRGTKARAKINQDWTRLVFHRSNAGPMESSRTKMGRIEDQDELWRSEPVSGEHHDSQAERAPESEKEVDVSAFKDELNLAEFPIAALTDRVPDGQNTLVFEDHLEQRDGPPIVRRLSISGHGKLGLPAALDDQVIVGLIQLTKRQNNFTNARVYFSRYELIELLGWPQDGHSYRRIEEALNRWVGVVLSYENAWWDNDEKSWVDETFHIIDNVTLYDREKAMNKASSAKGKRPKPMSSFRWNEVMFRSFQSGNLKQLDLEFYLGLRLPTSKRLYRFLDKRFYHRERVDFDLRILACEHVGMSREYAPTELKRRLRPALDELEKNGFLEPLHDNERYVNVEKGRWRILFVRGPKRRAEEDAAKETNTAEALHAELTSRGVHHLVASDLVSKHPSDRIRAKIEVFDWLVGHSDQHVQRNPAGYLVASIRDDYAIPDDYIPKLKKPRKSSSEQKSKSSSDKETKTTDQEVSLKPENASKKKNFKADPLADPEVEKLLVGHWNTIPECLRDEITEEVNRNHNGLLRWPALMLPHYLERMFQRFGLEYPMSQDPSANAIEEPVTDKVSGKPNTEHKPK